MYVPTRRLAAAVLVTAPVWWLAAIGSSFAFVVAPVLLGVLAIAALADALAIPGRRSVTVIRSFPASVGRAGCGDRDVRGIGAVAVPRGG